MLPVSLDILILAMVAGTILYKLYTILGTKDKDLERDLKNEPINFNNVIDLNKTSQVEVRDISNNTLLETESFPGFELVLKQIREIDPKFSLKKFIENAKAAFEMILTAFAEGDKDTLSNLLDKNIYQKFIQQIEQRSRNKHNLQLSLVTIPEVNPVDITIDGLIAKIKIAIKSQQVTILRDEKQKIIQGNPSQIDYIEDTWIFKRELLNSKNWILVDVGNS